MTGKEAHNKSEFPGGEDWRQPVEIIRPAAWTVPFIFTSPHSGRRYPGRFLAQSRLSLLELRRAEDSYVDLLAGDLPRLGAPLIKALFPRAMVDVNRSPQELDPLLIDGPLPPDAETRSPRVMAGFGVLPRLSADGAEIYDERLGLGETGRRLATCYRPWHETVEKMIGECLDRFGIAILIDCHSMPSQTMRGRQGGVLNTDFVLGDRYGRSCSGALTAVLQDLLQAPGYTVTRNAPYAGGYITRNYGNPGDNVHAIQLEINRRLYLDEQQITRTAGFQPLARQLTASLGELMTMDMQFLRPRFAAE